MKPDTLNTLVTMADSLIGLPVVSAGLVLGIAVVDRREKQQLEAAAKLIDDALIEYIGSGRYPQAEEVVRSLRLPPGDARRRRPGLRDDEPLWRVEIPLQISAEGEEHLLLQVRKCSVVGLAQAGRYQDAKRALTELDLPYKERWQLHHQAVLAHVQVLARVGKLDEAWDVVNGEYDLEVSARAELLRQIGTMKTVAEIAEAVARHDFSGARYLLRALDRKLAKQVEKAIRAAERQRKH